MLYLSYSIVFILMLVFLSNLWHKNFLSGLIHFCLILPLLKRPWHIMILIFFSVKVKTVMQK